MSRIIGARKANTGEICEVKLDTGTELTIQDAITQTEADKIEGVIFGTDRNGQPYLHSKRGQMSYKLSELPAF